MRRTLVSRPPFATQPQRSRSGLLGQTLLALAGTSSILLTGCLDYPDADGRFDDEIIYTRYDEANESKFAEYKTFAINPEVRVFEEDDGEIESDSLDQNLADQLVDQVVGNMKENGYEQVSKEDSPDLGLSLSLVKGKVTGYYGGYWGYYWGYPYWGYYYPYYVSYSYDTNTLLTDAVDLREAPPVVNPDPDPENPPDPEDRLNVLWTGLVYGVEESTLAENLEDALRGIDQAFKQSPYFKTSKGDE